MQLDILKGELAQHFARLDDFVSAQSAAGSSELVVGKVQSGKTGHFVATLAWAIDRGFAGAVVVSGTKKALSKQTLKRIASDLGPERLGHTRIDLYETPTVSQLSGAHQAYGVTFAARVRARLGQHYGHAARMPILVTLKHAKRVQAATEMLRMARPGSETRPFYLIIDDESDQASQNSPTAKRALTETYKALRDLRVMAGTHIFLGYTATPQAVLLADPTNAVAPEFVHVVEPGRGYFGLHDLLFEGQSEVAVAERRPHPRVHEIPDVTELSPGSTIPKSLVEALGRFLIVGGIRREWPTVFFSEAPSEAELAARPDHVSFLVHPSSATTPHNTAAKLVRDYFDTLGLDDPGRRDDIKDEVLIPAYRAWWAQLPERLRAQVPVPQLPNAKLDALLSDVIDTARDLLEIRLVNASQSSGPVPRGLPEESTGRDEWLDAKYWILIGGEILGRGITIENLVGTYFLRDPRSPAHDTVVQQMRFCGYRSDYLHQVDVWAPSRVILFYVALDEIDEIMTNVWRREDIRGRRLTNGLDIAYAVPQEGVGADLEPTRRSVRSTRLQDMRLDEILLATVHIGGPQLTALNAPRAADWLTDVGALHWDADLHNSAWRSAQLGGEDVLKLLDGFICTGNDDRRKRYVMNLLDPILGRWSLAGRRVEAFVHQLALLLSDPVGWDPASTSNGPITTRRRGKDSPLPPTARVWREQLETHSSGPMARMSPWEDARIASYIGDTHRGLRERHQLEGAVCLFLEPIGISSDAHETDPTRRTAIGLALGVLGPSDTDIRLIGHPRAKGTI